VHAGLVLTSASIDDLPDLVRLTRAFYDEDGFGASDEDIQRRFERFLVGEDARVMVARRDEVSCGFALTTIRLILESGLVAEIQDLFVDPAHRRNGIASALIEDAAVWARSRSASGLEVVVAPNGRDVTHLVRYYAARGFNDEGRRVLNRKL
jgi:aminoglycoside 6'-N-acetyltransferase I